MNSTRKELADFVLQHVTEAADSHSATHSLATMAANWSTNDKTLKKAIQDLEADGKLTMETTEDKSIRFCLADGRATEFTGRCGSRRPEIKLGMKKRTCIVTGCEKTFMSQHAGHRMCNTCRSNVSDAFTRSGLTTENGNHTSSFAGHQ